MNNQPLQKVTKSLYIVTHLGKLPFILFTQMARTWTLKEDSVNTSIIHWYSTRRKSFTKDSAEEAYVVQGSTNRSNNRGRSSSRPRTNQRSRSKSWETRICNYCKKLGHIKANCRLLWSKTDKAQRADQRSNRHEEVNCWETCPSGWNRM